MPRKYIVKWEGDESLSEECVYVFPRSDIELFVDVAGDGWNWIAYSDNLPGGEVGALVYGAVHWDCRIGSEYRLARSVLRWIDELVETARALDPGKLESLTQQERVLDLRRVAGLSNARYLIERLDNVVTWLDRVWRKSLLTDWRPLSERDPYAWTVASDVRELAGDIVSEIDAFPAIALPGQKVRTSCQEIAGICKRWQQSGIEDQLYFAAMYFLVRAKDALFCGKPTLCVLFVHRAVESVLIAYCVEEEEVEYSSVTRRFVFGNGKREEISLIRAAKRVFEPGSGMFKRARNLNVSRNTSYLTHGVDVATIDEASKSVEFCEQCFQRLRAGRNPGDVDLAERGWLPIGRKTIFDNEDSYSVYLTLNEVRADW